MKTVPEMLANVARANSDRIAVVDGARRVSYAELISRIDSLGLEFKQRGIVSGDRIALLLPNSLEFVLGYFAACSVGAIVVPMNAQYGESELLYFLDVCEVSVLITNDEHEELCREMADRCQVEGIPIYVLGLGVGSGSDWDPRLLEDLAITRQAEVNRLKRPAF